MAATLSALAAQHAGTDVIASYAEMLNNWQATSGQAGTFRPETFYNTQLLDTIRDAAECYQYYKYAKPIDMGGADKLTIRRWAPLQAHTTPLVEGVAPETDKGSVEKYEISAGNQYGRVMFFTDKVDFMVVDPVIAHYTNEYSIVAVETLDLLARDTLLTAAQKYFAYGATSFAGLTAVDATPALADFRLIGLALKKAKVKPIDATYHALVSAEFVYDMLDDPYVQNYMRINQSTGSLYDNQDGIVLPNMFGFSFHEVVNCPTSTAWYDSTNSDWRCIVTDGTNFYVGICDKTSGSVKKTSGYVKDKRTGKDASYIPNQITFTDALEGKKESLLTITSGVIGNAPGSNVTADLTIWKVNHILILGADALVRTAISGEDQARMYVKPLGSSGVLDPIDQRQSIGFKINNIGFGVTRLEAVIDYICVPTQLNV